MFRAKSVSTAKGRVERKPQTPQIDRLSTLPPEILESIFDLAATPNPCSSPPSPHSFATIAPSKSLVPFHEQALYRRVKIDNDTQLDKLLATLETHPDKGPLVKSISLYDVMLFVKEPLLIPAFFGKLPNLLEITVPTKSNRPPVDLFIKNLVTFPNCVRSLTALYFPGFYMFSSTLEWLEQIPNLRRLEVFNIWRVGGEPDPQAGNISEILITSPPGGTRDDLSESSYFLLFFPSAKITSLDVYVSDAEELSQLHRVLAPLSNSLENLRLQGNLPTSSRLPIEHLSSFIHLRSLDLGLDFAADISQVLPLKNLVSLSFGFTTIDRDLIKLLEGPQRLPHLRFLTLEYGPLERGPIFNMEVAEWEHDTGVQRLDRHGVALLAEFAAREVRGWTLPFNLLSNWYDGIDWAEEVEEAAREADIVVKSNLGLVRFTARRMLVEHYNRSVGLLYFHQAISFEQVLARLRHHDMRLPPLRIDVDSLKDRNDVEWFHEDVRDIVGDGRACHAVNLRYKGRG
ncbi:uncharacterized protein JCM6883_006290 [Sporobolomyces salmoneus]|uniref:uncharacterized protein n=1 Tax=Sporobolomyces salmoneus TaxID=183962 RepID=UPI00318017E3